MPSYYRRYALPGLLNCRDLGGYPLPGNRMTPYGAFVRSSCLTALPRGNPGQAGLHEPQAGH